MKKMVFASLFCSVLAFSSIAVISSFPSAANASSQTLDECMLKHNKDSYHKAFYSSFRHLNLSKEQKEQIKEIYQKEMGNQRQHRLSISDDMKTVITSKIFDEKLASDIAIDRAKQIQEWQVLNLRVKHDIYNNILNDAQRSQFNQHFEVMKKKMQDNHERNMKQ